MRCLVCFSKKFRTSYKKRPNKGTEYTETHLPNQRIVYGPDNALTLLILSLVLSELHPAPNKIYSIPVKPITDIGKIIIAR